jgi:hypothetical protein
MPTQSVGFILLKKGSEAFTPLPYFYLASVPDRFTTLVPSVSKLVKKASLLTKLQRESILANLKGFPVLAEIPCKITKSEALNWFNVDIFLIVLPINQR